MKFVPLTGATPEQLAEGINSSLRGELDSCGKFRIPIGSSEFTLQDSQIRPYRVIFLMPLNAAAADLHYFFSDQTKGSVKINLRSPALDDADFYYTVLGAGNLRGVM